jgi:predicted transposase
MKTTIQGCLIRLTDEKRDVTEDMIRRFESATRYSYARICDGVSILDIEKDVMQKFCINSRWAKDAVARAKAAYAVAERLVEKGKLSSPRKLVWGGRRNFEL